MADRDEVLREALRAQVEVSTLLMRRLGLDDRAIAHGTAQARAALAATDAKVGRPRRR